MLVEKEVVAGNRGSVWCVCGEDGNGAIRTVREGRNDGFDTGDSDTANSDD
jgi:hypothetical protein